MKTAIKRQMEQAMVNARIGLTGYPEVDFKPVPLTSET